MKRIILIIAIAALSSVLVQAQDIITQKDGQKIRAKVLEVSTDEVKYKLFDEPEGPDFIVKKSELTMIRYQSGRYETFNQKTAPSLYYTDRAPIENLTVGMKYKELKNLYNYKEYSPVAVDRYSPAWSGVASFFIPGLGQMICGEVGRGFAFLGGSIGGSILGGLALASGQQNNAPVASLAGTLIYAGVLALDIIAIVDGVRVAKVKNMYEQDLKKTYAFKMDFYPTFDYAMIGNTYQPTAGVKLAIRF